MRRITWLLGPIAAVSLAAGVAVAGSQSSETTPVTADFEAILVKQKERICDSSHTEFRVRFEGSQTSSDPRLGSRSRSPSASASATRRPPRQSTTISARSR